MLMRNLTHAEMLALTKALEMETNALAVGQASMMAVGDEPLQKMIQTGIDSTKTRIMALQQFVAENKIVSQQSNNTADTTARMEV
jgi:hypothetical protein